MTGPLEDSHPAGDGGCDQIRRLTSFCDHSADPVVAIVVDAPQDEDIFTQLGQRLAGRGVQPVLVYIAGQVDPALHTEVPIVVLPKSRLPDLKKIAAFVGRDNATRFPENSHVVHMPHAFLSLDAANGLPTARDLRTYASSMVTADAVFLPQACAARFAPEEYAAAWGGLFPDALAKRTGPFAIIPGGYLKIDLLMERMRSHDTTRDSVLVMPTVMGKTAHNYLDLYADMIEAALAATRADGANVIFRPFPSDKDSEVIRTIAMRYATVQRVVLDLAPSNIDAFSRARTLVTDYSLGRFTFSLATGLPHVTYVPGSGRAVDTHAMGLHANSRQDLEHVLSRILVGSSKTIQDFEATRDRMLVNPGGGYDCLINSVLAMIQGDRCREWIVFERRFIPGDWNRPETWQARIEDGESECMVLERLRHFASERFPDDPRFAARPPHGTVLDVDYAGRTFTPFRQEAIAAFAAAPETLPTYLIWGTGQNYRDHYRRMMLNAPDRCLGFIDRRDDTWGGSLDGKPVYAPDALTDLEPEVVIIASHAFQQICHTIRRLLADAAPGDERQGQHPL